MGQEQTIKKYISALFKRLCLPRKLKKRICGELESEIYSRLEEGEGFQDILSSAGSPEEVQREVGAGYETEFIYFKKSNNQ